MGYPRPRQTSTRARNAVIARARIENGGTNLGALPLVVASAIPSVKTLATKAINSIIGIFDPGKKRDANRKARATFWGDTAVAGSITAARRVLSGRTMVYTTEEKALYNAQWSRLVGANPSLAAKAQSLGNMPDGIPEPGSDASPPFSVPPDVLASLQEEINVYHGSTATAADVDAAADAKAAAKPSQAGTGLLFGLGILGALLAGRKRR